MADVEVCTTHGGPPHEEEGAGSAIHTARTPQRLGVRTIAGLEHAIGATEEHATMHRLRHILGPRHRNTVPQWGLAPTAPTARAHDVRRCRDKDGTRMRGPRGSCSYGSDSCGPPTADVLRRGTGPSICGDASYVPAAPRPQQQAWYRTRERAGQTHGGHAAAARNSSTAG